MKAVLSENWICVCSKMVINVSTGGAINSHSKINCICKGILIQPLPSCYVFKSPANDAHAIFYYWSKKESSSTVTGHELFCFWNSWQQFEQQETPVKTSFLHLEQQNRVSASTTLTKFTQWVHTNFLRFQYFWSF